MEDLWYALQFCDRGAGVKQGRRAYGLQHDDHDNREVKVDITSMPLEMILELVLRGDNNNNDDDNNYYYCRKKTPFRAKKNKKNK